MSTDGLNVKKFLDSQLYSQLERLFENPSQSFVPKKESPGVLQRLTGSEKPIDEKDFKNFGSLIHNEKVWNICYFWGNDTSKKTHYLFLVIYNQDDLIVSIHDSREKTLAQFSTITPFTTNFLRGATIDKQHRVILSFPEAHWNRFVKDNLEKDSLKDIRCQIDFAGNLSKFGVKKGTSSLSIALRVIFTLAALYLAYRVGRFFLSR